MKKLFKGRRKFVFGAIIIVIALILWQTIFKSKAVAQSTTIQKGDVATNLTLSGAVDSTEKATLQFQSPGLISWVGVKEGDYVTKGQGIASIDTRIANLDLQKSLNLYGLNRLDFDQTNQDNQNYLENPDSAARDRIKRSLDKAQLTLNNTVLDVQSQTVAISLSSISSPISGVVTNINNAIAGANVVVGQTQFEIVNPNTIYLSVTADQTDVVNVKVGDVASIVMDAYPDQTLQGKVIKIGFTPETNQTGTVYEVKIAFENLSSQDIKNLKFKIGMTGDANFTTNEKKDVLYVAPQYIKEDTKGKYLLVGPKKEKVYIQTGLEGTDRVEVNGNIKEGDIIFIN